MPVHIFSVFACMTGCNVFKWLGKDTPTSLWCPTPSPNSPPPQKNTHPNMTVLLGFLHRHHPPQNFLAPKTCGWFVFFFLCEFMALLSIWVFCLKNDISYLLSFILSKLSFGSWRVQVRFAASGSTGRMSPSRQWSSTSPLARGSSDPRKSWTASCRRSTPSLSKLMTVVRVPMAPTWRNPTSESTVWVPILITKGNTHQLTWACPYGHLYTAVYL